MTEHVGNPVAYVVYGMRFDCREWTTEQEGAAFEGIQNLAVIHSHESRFVVVGETLASLAFATNEDLAQKVETLTQSKILNVLDRLGKLDLPKGGVMGTWLVADHE